MNILITATTFPRWKNDKVPYFIFDLCKAYIKHGSNVIVLAPHYNEAKFQENIEGVKIYRFPYFFPFFLQRIAYDGGILGNLNKSILAKIQVPLFLIFDLIFMLWVIKKEKIKLIHSHWIISQGIIASIVSKITSISHINTIHAGDLALLEKLPFKNIIAKFVFNNTNLITVVSNHGLKRLKKILGDRNIDLDRKAIVLPMGVDLEEFKINLSGSQLRGKYKISEKRVVLFIGRLSEKKGIKYLLNSFPQILSQFPNTRLIIIGDGPDRNNLEELSLKLGIKSSVSFMGFIVGEKKIHFLKMADVLVIPSIDTEGKDTEGLPVVLLEGLAAGTSIVASNVGGIGDVIKNQINGTLIKQKDSQELEMAVSKLLENSKIRERYRRNSAPIVRNYDWNVIGGKYHKIARSVL